MPFILIFRIKTIIKCIIDDRFICYFYNKNYVFTRIEHKSILNLHVNEINVIRESAHKSNVTCGVASEVVSSMHLARYFVSKQCN